MHLCLNLGAAGNTTTTTTFGLTVGQIRLHEGLLQPDEIMYKYALDVAYYRGAQAWTRGVTPIPSASASPSAGAVSTVCPSSWSTANSHYVKTISLNNWNDTSAYARHCGYWLFWTTAFPVTDAVASGDASQVR